MTKKEKYAWLFIQEALRENVNNGTDAAWILAQFTKELRKWLA